jgi:hypothetical protein
LVTDALRDQKIRSVATKDSAPKVETIGTAGIHFAFPGKLLRGGGLMRAYREGILDRLPSIGSLAALYAETGQYAKADRLELRSAVTRASEFGLDNADTAWLLAS